MGYDPRLIGQAMVSLTYATLKSLLRVRFSTSGQEWRTANGFVWKARNHRLFWNKHVVKSGSYPKGGMFSKGTRRRLADLVLTNEGLPDELLRPTPSGNETPFGKAILAIECKNDNLQYRWGFPTHVKMFDRDVMTRFIWVAPPPDSVEKVLGLDADWEKSARFQNMFPKAVKLLILPNFIFIDRAEQEQRLKSRIEKLRQARLKLGKIKDMTFSDAFRVELYMQDKIEHDLAPPSTLPQDAIEWRIRRLRLRVHELGFHPLPNEPIPTSVRLKMRQILDPYVSSLTPE
jgi:hypothetical protein